MPGRCVHVTCIQLCVCASSEKCDNARGVSLLLTRIRDVLGHTGNDGVGHRGHQKEINSARNPKQQPAMTLEQHV